MQTSKDELGYTVIAAGVDAGRYATPEVASQAYSDELCGLISDLSKDAMGFRSPIDFSDSGFFQMEMEADYWASCIERELNAEEHARKESLEAFTKYAPDAETAKRWLKEIV